MKIVDYRSVNLAWLIEFKAQIQQGRLAKEINLVVAREDVTDGKFHVRAGDTLCVEGRKGKSLKVSVPYGEVRSGSVVATSVKEKSRSDWTTEDVCEYVIKRSCMKKQCTYLEIMPKDAVSSKEYQGTFVSQARKCKFEDLVGSISYFYTLKKEDMKDKFLWLDIFSANQPKLTARNVEPFVQKENERQLTMGLHQAIANFDERVMFMDKWDAATPLTRAWCVWEIFGVDKAEKNLEIALPESEYDRFIVALKQDYTTILGTIAKVDVAKAQCFNPADLESIHKEIRQKSSFEALDDIIKTQLRLWVASTGKREVEKEEMKPNKNLEEISLLANLVANTFRDQGHYESAEPLLRKALKIAEDISKDRESDPTVGTRLNDLALVLREQVKNCEHTPHQAKTLCIEQNILSTCAIGRAC